MHLATDPLDLLFDADGSGFEVDVLPAESEDFATVQAIEDEQDERYVERVRLGDGQELPRLFGCPRPDGPSVPLRQFDQPGDVARDQLLAS